MTMPFTGSQRAVLNEIEENRLTVVRAGPGAGKTRVFVEAFKREIDRSTSTRFGVAALSFTNVAHEEISRRMGGLVGPPHFIGTLDAFFWRFVVRPFGALAGLTTKGARLLPSPLDEMQTGPVAHYGPGDGDRATVFELKTVGGTEITPLLNLKVRRASHSIVVRIAPAFTNKVMEAKRGEWERNGRVTHSDVQFLASCILRGRYGTEVRRLVARRFPVVLIDEFQDTTHFLGRAALALLEVPSIRGAVVGDPDQAIFQFGGATRSFFQDAEHLAGRRASVLDVSHRCPRTVAAVATALSRSGKPVTSLAGAPDGRSLMLVHDQKQPSIDAVLASLTRVCGNRKPLVLARATTTVRKLAQAQGAPDCPLGCRFARGLNRASQRIHAGDPTSAARITWKELASLAFGEDDLDLDELRERSVSPLAWRKACHALLFEAAKGASGETWNAWAARLKRRLGAELVTLAVQVDRLGAKVKSFGKAGEELRVKVASAHEHPCEVMTVHQAKGREFPLVLLYYPKPHRKNAPCPSGEWWSDEDGNEEREVAFVACSRSKDVLALAVHRETFGALRKDHPEFVELFEVFEQEPPEAKKTARRSRRAGSTCTATVATVKVDSGSSP